MTPLEGKGEEEEEEEQEGHWEQIQSREGLWEKKGYSHELKNKVSTSTTTANESHPTKVSQGMETRPDEEMTPLRNQGGELEHWREFGAACTRPPPQETQPEKETQRLLPQASLQSQAEEQQQQGQQEPPEKEEWSEEEWEAPEEPPQNHNDLWWEQQYWEIEREAEHFRRDGTTRVTWKNWLAFWAISGVVVSVAVWLGLRARVTAGKLWEIGTEVNIVRAWVAVGRREMDARVEVARAWLGVWRGRVEGLRDWLDSL